MYQEITVNGHGNKLLVPQATYDLRAANQQRTRSRFDEYGVVGIDLFAGIYREADILGFRWPGAWPYIDEMLRTNPQIAAVKRMFMQWAGQIKLEWVPAHEEPSAVAQQRAGFANSVLNDLEGGSKKLARQMVATVPFNGFQLWEIVPGMRTGAEMGNWRSKYRDGRLGIRKIAIRYLSSFYDWQYEDEESGEWTGWRQQTTRGRLITIPRKEGNLPRLLHIVYGGDNTNPEGWTPLEAAWRIHRVMKGLSFIEGLGYERSAGHVKWTAYESPSPADKAVMGRSSRAVMSAQEGNYAIEIFEKLMMNLVDVPFSSAGALHQAILSKKVELLSMYDQDWQAMASLTGVGAYEAIRARLVTAVDSYNSMMDDFADQAGQQLYEFMFGMEDRERGFVEEDEIKLTASNIKPPVTQAELAMFVSSVWDKLIVDEQDQIALRTMSGFLREEVPEAPAPQPIAPQPPKIAASDDSEGDGEDEDTAEDVAEQAQGDRLAELMAMVAELQQAVDRQEARPLDDNGLAAVVSDALAWAREEGMFE